MAEVSEQSVGLTDMMKQLMESFNDLKANQIETREALRGIQARTEAVEVHLLVHRVNTPTDCSTFCSALAVQTPTFNLRGLSPNATRTGQNTSCEHAPLGHNTRCLDSGLEKYISFFLNHACLFI
jgi:hypothetical protein